MISGNHCLLWLVNSYHASNGGVNGAEDGRRRKFLGPGMPIGVMAIVSRERLCHGTIRRG